VIFESVSRSVPRADQSKVREVHELNMIELEPAPDGKGVEGLWVVLAKTWMDLSTIIASHD